MKKLLNKFIHFLIIDYISMFLRLFIEHHIGVLNCYIDIFCVAQLDLLFLNH